MRQMMFAQYLNEEQPIPSCIPAAGDGEQSSASATLSTLAYEFDVQLLLHDLLAHSNALSSHQNPEYQHWFLGARKHVGLESSLQIQKVLVGLLPNLFPVCPLGYPVGP